MLQRVKNDAGESCLEGKRPRSGVLDEEQRQISGRPLNHFRFNISIFRYSQTTCSI